MKRIAYIPAEAKAILINRENRFLAYVNIISPFKESKVPVHIHDPGRLKEILFPGNVLLLKRAENSKRKTQWDVVAGKVNNSWVLIHSGYHRKIAEAILSNPLLSPFEGISNVKAEPKYKRSRLDFLLKNKQNIWLEVKGCTLAIDNVALFPDAPTARGRVHLEHLIELKQNGERAAVLFLVFRNDAKFFSPNWETDPLFSQKLQEAKRAGVEIYAVKLSYDGENLFFKEYLPLKNV